MNMKTYNLKIFVRNHFSEWLEVLLKINFVINEIKVYLRNFFSLNVHKATSLLDLGKPQRH